HNNKARSFHNSEMRGLWFAPRRRLCQRRMAILVPRFVVAFLFLLELEFPVLLAITARSQAPHPQHGSGPFQPPARGSDFPSIFDHGWASSFDHPSRDWIAFR